MSMSPIQKMGVAYESSAKTLTAASTQVFTYRAASTPSRMPSVTARVMAVPMSTRVAGSRVRMRSEHRQLVAEREAEVEREHLAEVEAELDEERPVQAEVGAKLGHVLRRGGPGLAGEHVGGVARRQVQQREVEHHHGEHHRHRLREPAPRIAQARPRHRRPTARVARPYAARDARGRPATGEERMMEVVGVP